MHAPSLSTSHQDILRTDREHFNLFPDAAEDAAVAIAEAIPAQPALLASAQLPDNYAALADAAAPLDAVGTWRLVETLAARHLPAAIGIALGRIGSHLNVQAPLAAACVAPAGASTRGHGLRLPAVAGGVAALLTQDGAQQSPAWDSPDSARRPAAGRPVSNS
jgi:hypothetical protein